VRSAAAESVVHEVWRRICVVGNGATRMTADRMAAQRAPGGDVLRAVVLLGAILVGGGVGHALMPSIYHRVPLSDMRVEMIVDALRRKDIAPQIALFGNSITGSALHDTSLSKALPGEPFVVNLSTPLQGLAEAFLLYQELWPSTWIVVQQVTPWDIVEREPFARFRFNAYYAFGYRPTARTAEILSDAFGPETAKQLAAGDAAQRFEERWVVSRLLDIAFWLNLPTQLYLDSRGRDVFFFWNNNTRLDDRLFRFILRHWQVHLSKADPIAFEAKRNLVKASIVELERSRRRAVLWVPPIHPEIRQQSSPAVWRQFEVLLADARAAGAVVIDLRAEEGDDGFRDSVHFKLDATERITKALAAGLQAAGLFPRKPAAD